MSIFECLANNLGATDLVAISDEDFVKIGVGLAGDLPCLSEL